MESTIIVLTLLMTSCIVTNAVKEKSLTWKRKQVNESVTAEANIDILVKNYDDSGDLVGTLTIGLFGDTVPMTVLNFLTICNGVKRPTGQLRYSGSVCHRIIPDMHLQCGDVVNGDGSGGTSIYGDTFNDENFDIGLSEPGTIAMANRGPNSNGSQFFIIFRSQQNLDGKHVAFGQITDKASLDFLKKINEIPVNLQSFEPKRRIKIVDCSASNLKTTKLVSRGPALENK